MDKLLKDNADIPNPSTPDEKEYKEERDKVQKAKDLAADAGDTEKMKTYERKLSAKLAFEIYIDRRENLKMRINQVIEVAEKSNKTQIADYLKAAVDQINDIKESEIKRALDDLAETTTTTGPITTQTPESLLSLLTKLLNSGGSLFSPNLINQIITAPEGNNDAISELNNLFKKLLKEIDNIQRDDDYDDDDWFDWPEWIQF